MRTGLRVLLGGTPVLPVARTVLRVRVVRPTIEAPRIEEAEVVVVPPGDVMILPAMVAARSSSGVTVGAVALLAPVGIRVATPVEETPAAVVAVAMVAAEAAVVEETDSSPLMTSVA